MDQGDHVVMITIGFMVLIVLVCWGIMTRLGFLRRSRILPGEYLRVLDFEIWKKEFQIKEEMEKIHPEVCLTFPEIRYALRRLEKDGLAESRPQLDIIGGERMKLVEVPEYRRKGFDGETFEQYPLNSQPIKSEAP